MNPPAEPAVRTLRFRLTFLSPAFLGGADQRPELRAASLRGVLRYWYRALHGHGTETSPLPGEQALFGGTERRGALAVAAVGDSAQPVGPLWGWTPPAPEPLPPSPKPGRRAPLRLDGVSYLLFFMRGFENRPGREALPAGTGGRLQFHLAPGADGEAFLRTLAAAAHLGGLGARSRRGAGAFLLTAGDSLPPHWASFFREEDLPDSPAGLCRRLEALLRPHLERPVVASPRYPVFGKGVAAAGVINRAFDSWGEALDYLGQRLILFRRRRDPIHRAVFGLPIRLRGNPDRILAPLGARRRASPLLFTLNPIRQEKKTKLVLTWTLFRATLTPRGRVSLRPPPENVRPAFPEPHFRILAEFLKHRVMASLLVGGSTL